MKDLRAEQLNCYDSRVYVVVPYIQEAYEGISGLGGVRFLSLSKLAIMLFCPAILQLKVRNLRAARNRHNFYIDPTKPCRKLRKLAAVKAREKY